MEITGSIVAYNTKPEILLKVITSFLSTNLDVKLFISDNSANSSLESLCKDDRIIYSFNNNNNLGFGKAHNKCIIQALKLNSNYHVILNPDVHFKNGILEELKSFMDENQEIGLISPKILYPNSEIQYSCRLIPTPLDLLLRRLKIFNGRNEKNELRFTNYQRIMEVPFLLGCFLFARTEILRLTGLFDERFFIYMEDLDLTRRISQISQCIFYPYTEIYHHYERASRSNVRLSFVHFISMLKYFSKWGWLFDSERDKINQRTLEMLDHD